MREAIIQLSDEHLEAIGLADIVTTTREAGLRDVTELVCHGAGGVLQVRVDEAIPATALDSFESVVWWERLTSTDDAVTYLCKVEPTDATEEHALDEHATAHDVTTVCEDGLELSVVGSQEEISQSVTALEASGMTPLLKRLTSYKGTSTTSLDSLTDRQREVVETAFEMGYYAVPRTATTQEVASAVDLDPSTVAEHLQRAERNVLDQVLAGSG